MVALTVVLVSSWAETGSPWGHLVVVSSWAETGSHGGTSSHSDCSLYSQGLVVHIGMRITQLFLHLVPRLTPGRVAIYLTHLAQ